MEIGLQKLLALFWWKVFGQLWIWLQSFSNSISFSRNFERQNLILQYFQAQPKDENDANNSNFIISPLHSSTTAGELNENTFLVT